jgi:hypothetical protein
MTEKLCKMLSRQAYCRWLESVMLCWAHQNARDQAAKITVPVRDWLVHLILAALPSPVAVPPRGDADREIKLLGPAANALGAPAASSDEFHLASIPFPLVRPSCSPVGELTEFHLARCGQWAPRARQSTHEDEDEREAIPSLHAPCHCSRLLSLLPSSSSSTWYGTLHEACMLTLSPHFLAYLNIPYKWSYKILVMFYIVGFI